MTKTKKQNLKHKVFKISAIISFILNGLMILFILIGLAGSSAKTLQTNAVDSINYNSLVDSQFQPYTTDKYSYDYCGYRLQPSNIDSVFSVVYKGTITSDYSDLFTITCDSFSYIVNDNLRYDGNRIVFKVHNASSSAINYQIRMTFYSDNTYLGFKDFTKWNTLETDTLYFKSLISVDNSKNYCDLFFLLFNTYLNPYIDIDSKYVLNPFFSVDDLQVGVFYPVNSRWYGFEGADGFSYVSILGFLIDVDNSFKIITADSRVIHVGFVRLDSRGNHYVKFINDSEITMLDSENVGYYFLYRSTNPFLNHFLSGNSLSVLKNINNEEFINFKSSCYFAWTEFLAYISLFNENVLIRNIKVPFTISELNGVNFNNIALADNGLNGHMGTITFLDSVNSYNFYQWNNNIDLSNLSDLYFGESLYNIVLEYPYFLTLDFDGFISLEDYSLLYTFLVPLNAYISHVNPFVETTSSFDNVFTLLGSAVSGVFNCFNIEVFPGLTLLTLMLVPLFILLIITIIKLVKG